MVVVSHHQEEKPPQVNNCEYQVKINSGVWKCETAEQFAISHPPMTREQENIVTALVGMIILGFIIAIYRITRD